MKMHNEMFSVFPLEWDSGFFGVSIGKVVLHSALIPSLWADLLESLSNYELVVIENRDANPTNAQLIGTTTNAFIADTNIQFCKESVEWTSPSRTIAISGNVPPDHSILNMTEFEFSRFLDDPKLRERGGERVYREWANNSFEKENKYFGRFIDSSGNLSGYILFSFIDNTCFIELLAVARDSFGRGIGQDLFKAAEQYSHEHRISTIKVGTQLRNLSAINLYHKLGCRQVACRQIFHLWNTSVS